MNLENLACVVGGVLIGLAVARLARVWYEPEYDDADPASGLITTSRAALLNALSAVSFVPSSILTNGTIADVTRLAVSHLCNYKAMLDKLNSGTTISWYSAQLNRNLVFVPQGMNTRDPKTGKFHAPLGKKKRTRSKVAK